MIRSKEEVKGEVESEVPDVIVDAVAKRIFVRYGEELANFINEKLSRRFELIDERLSRLEVDVDHLRGATDQKLREFIRIALEADFESIAERSAKSVVKQIAGQIEAIKSLDGKISVLSGKIEELSSSLKKIDKIVDEIRKMADKTSEILSDVESTLRNFRDEIQSTVRETIDYVKKNVVVDKTVIKIAVEEAVSDIVSKEFEEIEKRLNSTVESLKKEVKDLKGKVDDVIKAFDGVDKKVDILLQSRLPESPSKQRTDTFEE